MKRVVPTISHARLLENFSYDAETGIFQRIRKTSSAARLGIVRGNLMGNGYRATSVENQHIYLHRLAWFFVHGKWPDIVDHANGEKTDNRLRNLRDGTQAQNMKNIKKPRGVFLGAGRHKEKFTADIRVDGKKKYLGIFATAWAAHQAYLTARRSRDLVAG